MKKREPFGLPCTRTYPLELTQILQEGCSIHFLLLPSLFLDFFSTRFTARLDISTYSQGESSFILLMVVAENLFALKLAGLINQVGVDQ